MPLERCQRKRCQGYNCSEDVKRVKFASIWNICELNVWKGIWNKQFVLEIVQATWFNWDHGGILQPELIDNNDILLFCWSECGWSYHCSTYPLNHWKRAYKRAPVSFYLLVHEIRSMNLKFSLTDRVQQMQLKISDTIQCTSRTWNKRTSVTRKKFLSRIISALKKNVLNNIP